MRDDPLAGLSRETLARRTLSVLHRGRFGNPDVLLVETPAGRAVVKDFAPRSPLVRWTLGRWLTRREIRIYRALEGHPAVPRWLGRIDALAFAVEYRPGRRMSRRLRRDLPAGFADELERAVVAMHARGVVHLDLRHRSNVLADAQGRPVLIDFASSLRLDPDGRFGGRLLRWLSRIDRAAVAKWRDRVEAG